MTVEEAMLSSSSLPFPAGFSHEPEPAKGAIVQRFLQPFPLSDFHKSIIVRFRSHDNVLLAVLGNILHKRGGKRCRQVSASHGRRRPKLAEAFQRPVRRWAKRRKDTV